MSETKKTSKSKFLAKDMTEILDDSQFVKTTPKKKPQKRQRKEDNGGEEDISKLIGMYQASVKKNKTEPAFDSKQTRQKLLNVMNQQLLTRNHLNGNFVKNLMDIITQLEADYDVLRENEQKLEHLANVFIKCIKQTSSAQKQNLKALKNIHSIFKKEVEGLISRGGIKPDDRPIWYDVYRAFPPLAEPKFARPKPEIKPIRQILYKEDVVRAKFHSNGHGLGAVNMLNPIGDTHTKKLVQQYEKLQAEGVPESEIIEKAVSAVGLERQQQQDAPKLTPKNPNSVTAQVLTDADLKNIFKEEK